MSCPNCIREEGYFFGVDYRCAKTNEIITDKSKYTYQCTGNYYDECEIYKRTTSSSGCFLTTIVHQILGKKDNDEILENFRLFRDNILQKNEKYHNILKEYDVIGPMIVECIELDENKEKMANTIYKHILLPLDNKIKNKEYDYAVNMYQCMTMFLVEYYGLTLEYEKIRAKDYGYTNFESKTAGHGHCLKKVMAK